MTLIHLSINHQIIKVLSAENNSHFLFLKVWLDVPITNPSTYQFILRYTNPNPTPVEGKVTMHAPNEDGGISEGSGEQASAPIAETVENYVVLPPTGGQVE